MTTHSTQSKAITLKEMYAERAFVLSYELFPPKTPKGREALRGHLERLIEFEPDFITCTYGAGGSTRDKTLDTLKLVRELTDVPIASHLTCVGASVDDLRAYLRRAQAQGIDYIVALRGDAPKGDLEFKPAEDGLCYGNELVSLIKDEFPNFSIAVAGYPETHPEAPSPDADLENLRRKVDAGADVVITQMFYVNDDFYRWRDRCADAGLTVPIVPGVMPITNFKQIQKIASMCGATLPAPLCDSLEACGDDTEAQFEVGVSWATRQVQDMLDNGIPGIHFYVLNKSAATTTLLDSVTFPRV